MGDTLRQLIDQYRNDADSSFLKLQHQVRLRRERLLTRIGREHGGHELQDIRTRTLIAWHREWVSGGKFAMAKAMVDVLRVLFRFGASILENLECGRLCNALEEVQLQNSTSRSEPITSEHVRAIRAAAHDHFGWHCLALAQALQHVGWVERSDTHYVNRVGHFGKQLFCAQQVMGFASAQPVLRALSP